VLTIHGLVIDRLQKIQLVANDISTAAKEQASVYEASLEPFSPLFYLLVDQYPREFEKYRLDEIVVAAIAPLVRRMVASWNPLDDPSAFASTFRTWRRALRVGTPEEQLPSLHVDVYGTQTIRATSAEV
jgi:tuftelin-interacting protein 11